MLREVRERLAERSVTLELTDAAKEALVREGYDRGLRRPAAAPDDRAADREPAVQAHPRPASSPRAATVMVDYADGEYTFEEAPGRTLRKKEPVAAKA